MKYSPALALILLTCALAACKPPPTDADLSRAIPEAAPTFASDPLPSPETEGAIWAHSVQDEGRIIYGTPGNPALLALECVADEGELPALHIIRLSPADEGAGALLALVGNGHIGRVEVDAEEFGGRSVWQGSAPAVQTLWEPLAGPRQLTATVPGAGMVTLNPSHLPGELIEACRTGTVWPAPVPTEPPESDEISPSEPELGLTS